MSDQRLDQVKLFAMSIQLAENELDRVEQEFAIDLQRGHKRYLEKDQTYYPQLDHEVRQEAARMSEYYEIFYSLERTIRSLVEDTLEVAEGDKWWDSARVVPKIKQEAEARRQKEVDSGNTPRSDNFLDYTTFGELGELIRHSWDLFGSPFSSPKAVETVMARLNTLRGPIAHCSPLAEDEVVRLQLSVRDWFRLME